MLENYSGFTFTELDFTKALIYELKKHSITSFSKTMIEEELFIYHDKYLPLFADIDCRDKKLHLDKSIGTLTIYGTIFDLSPNFDIKYISNLIDLKSGNEYQPYYNLMASLVEEYTTKKKLEEGYLRDFRAKLKIYNINPNQKFRLFSGALGVDCISWDIVTPGRIIRGKTEYFTKSPFAIEIPKQKSREWSYLEDGCMEEIEIEDAQFVALQGKINDFLVCMNLYCEDTERNELIDKILRSTLPKQNNCQVLSLRKNKEVI